MDLTSIFASRSCCLASSPLLLNASRTMLAPMSVSNPSAIHSVTALDPFENRLAP
jgi:hypothetical protein